VKRQEDVKRLYELLNDVTLALHPRGEIGHYDADLETFISRFEPEDPGSDPQAYNPVPPAPEGDVEVDDRTPQERRRRLDELAEEIRQCSRCPLSLGRTNAVPGEGVLDPLVMIIGEGPGAQEDQEGSPFVGRAGQYLDKWLTAIGLSREENVFIANIVKCRPPNNRDPNPEESDLCLPFLQEQIALVRPRLILTVGRISTRILTGTSNGITRIHGTFYHYQGIPLVPTFHPSGVLRNPAWRRPVWEDLKSVRNWLIDNAGHAGA
jgi:uracil-DNA glycosylase